MVTKDTQEKTTFTETWPYILLCQHEMQCSFVIFWKPQWDSQETFNFSLNQCPIEAPNQMIAFAGNEEKIKERWIVSWDF